MARTTRSKAVAPTKSGSAERAPAADNSESSSALPVQTNNPPRVFILPTEASADARVVSLLCARTGKPARYLVCPESGIYEFTRVSALKSTPKSWLIEPGPPNGGPLSTSQSETLGESRVFHARITKGADLYVATPVDPLFLVLPAVATHPVSSTAKADEKKLFLSGDDHFDSIAQLSPHLTEILRWAGGKLQKLLESRMASICDTVEAGDELMFRFSEEKLLNELLGKARSLARQALPKSMEEKFVTKALEAPMLGLKVRDVSTDTAKSTVVGEDTAEEKEQCSVSTPMSPRGADSQSSASASDATASFASDISMTSTAATSLLATPELDEEEAKGTVTDLTSAVQARPEIVALQRLRVAFSYICSAYLSPARAASVKALLARDVGASMVDFAPLDAYLAKIAKMREDAASARSMSDYSRKRVLDDDEAAERAEKKRLKEEEDRRKKAGESRGVKNLKKVNTTGMKKMSDFFKKKA
ncbi:ribonuclease H2, subunit B [Microdochium trichocladiopsis]|uniref:Ribonuclease H2 subunit B n=1 Tax=Microdochium trichocladiopsis TaxID=1682393 RepID=A0A9P8XYT4_9PEZI|nr:ribonuclease H2, subunit B [Microdochium trichocladiopsis]KAH7021038.1 ribonuclease H2, subunit B [Microdochium trichocladiopsis]